MNTSYSINRCNHFSTSGPSVTMGIGDSGTTGSCACFNAKVVDVKPAGNLSIKVSLANGTHVHSTHIGYLPQQHLPLQARLVHLFPKLNKVLLSLSQFCDADMKIILTKRNYLRLWMTNPTM